MNQNTVVSNLDIIEADNYSVINSLSDVSNDPFKLHTLSYNIKYPPPRTSTPIRAPKIGTAIKTIKDNYDVIALQECFFELYYENIQHNAKIGETEYKYNSKIVGYPNNFVFHDSGGAVFLSKWPIVNEWEHVFSENTIDDGFKRQRKGVIAIKIDKKGQYYYLVTTHLSPYQKHNKVRLKQLKEINKFIRENLIEAYPIILMGDFNIIYGSSEESNIYEMISALEYVKNSGYYQYSWDGKLNNLAGDGEQYTIDYIFYWNDSVHKKPINNSAKLVRPIENGTADLSDHFAIQGIFEFN